MSQATTNENKLDVAAIDRFLRSRGWNMSQDDFLTWESPDLAGHGVGWVVEMDTDVNAIEIYRCEGGFREDISELLSFEELEAELVSLGAIAWSCRYCGEEGGDPAGVAWDEYQGVEGHGGMVTFTEERCTKCVGGRS